MYSYSRAIFVVLNFRRLCMVSNNLEACGTSVCKSILNTVFVKTLHLIVTFFSLAPTIFYALIHSLIHGDNCLWKWFSNSELHAPMRAKLFNHFYSFYSLSHIVSKPEFIVQKIIKNLEPKSSSRHWMYWHRLFELYKEVPISKPIILTNYWLCSFCRWLCDCQVENVRNEGLLIALKCKPYTITSNH